MVELVPLHFTKYAIWPMSLERLLSAGLPRFQTLHSGVPAEGMSGEAVNPTCVGFGFQRQISSTAVCEAKIVSSEA